MKILLASFLYKPHFGGVENSLAHLASVFVSRGVSVDIVASDRPDASNSCLPKAERVGRCNIYRFPAYKSQYSIFNALSSMKDIKSAQLLIDKLEADNSYDLVLCRDHRLVLATSGILSLRGRVIYLLPGITNFQDKSFYSFLPGTIGKVKSWAIHLLVSLPKNHLQSRAVREAGCCLVFSVNMQMQLELVNRKKVIVKQCNAGVDSIRFDSERTDFFENRDDLQIDKQDILAIIVCRLIREKGVDVAIKALAQSGNRKLKLLIVGEGPQMEALSLLAKQLNMEKRVIFYGKSTSPEGLYRMADLFIMSSSYEPFGQTILEAMSSALPVIGFKRDFDKGIMTATQEIVDHGKGGYLVSTAAEMARCLSEFCLLSKTEKEKMGGYNRAKVRRQYTWEGLADYLLDVNSSL